jgi:hypothetical protein
MMPACYNFGLVNYVFDLLIKLKIVFFKPRNKLFRLNI